MIYFFSFHTSDAWAAVPGAGKIEALYPYLYITKMTWGAVYVKYIFGAVEEKKSVFLRDYHSYTARIYFNLFSAERAVGTHYNREILAKRERVGIIF